MEWPNNNNGFEQIPIKTSESLNNIKPGLWWTFEDSLVDSLNDSNAKINTDPF